MAAHSVARLFSRWSPTLTRACIRFGEQLYSDGRYTQAYKELLPLANRGVLPAQRILGTMYHEGHGVEQDSAEAARWFRLAAEAGDADAQFNLSVMCSNGWGMPEDQVERARWLRHAAEQGHALSQYALGVLYRDAVGVRADDGKALWWLQLAANQGEVSAQLALGVMYIQGKADPTGSALTESMIQAHAWLTLASARGDERASKALAVVAKQMTPDAMAEAEQCVKDWQPEGSTNSAVRIYRYEVARILESFKALAEATPRVALTEISRLQRRIDEFIDVGIILGAPVDDLVTSLRRIHQTLTEELVRVLPAVREHHARIDGLKEVVRAPGLRPWFKRPLITVDTDQTGICATESSTEGSQN